MPKILLFLNKSKLKYFFELIKAKYETDFPAFIKYFYINYFKKYPLNDLCWNYDLNFIFESNSIDDFFLTNNICESTNRLLNMNYYGVCKSLQNFEEAIKSLIKLYEEKNKYVEGNFSITRAIALYVRTEKIDDLINSNKMKIIFKNYTNYLKERNLDYEEKNNGDNILEEYLDNTSNINNINNYSSNYESSSSIDSDEEIIYDYLSFGTNNKNSDDTDSHNSNSDINDSNIIKHKKAKKNKNKSKKYRNNNKTDEHENINCNIHFIKNYLEDNEQINFDNYNMSNKFNKIKKEDVIHQCLNQYHLLIELPLYENNKVFSYFQRINNDEFYNSKSYHYERENYKLYLRKQKLETFINNMRFKLNNLNID